eukprot:UN05214
MSYDDVSASEQAKPANGIFFALAYVLVLTFLGIYLHFLTRYEYNAFDKRLKLTQRRKRTKYLTLFSMLMLILGMSVNFGNFE